MSTQAVESALQAAVDAIASRISSPPSVALILGSGLGEFADELENPVLIDSREIPHYPRSTVQGHSGKLVFGTLSTGKRQSPALLVFQGRIHFYEQGDLTPVTFPVRLAKRLGASDLIVTNASGGISQSLNPGDFMLVHDLLSLTFLPCQTPSSSSARPGLPNADRRKFARPFDERLQELVVRAAGDLHINLARGVYCWLKGPTYETAAEIEMLRRIGADAVGMSTVPEIAAADELGMRVVAISLITNMATGIKSQKLSHNEVMEMAERVKPTFSSLMREVLLRMGTEGQGAKK